MTIWIVPSAMGVVLAVALFLRQALPRHWTWSALAVGLVNLLIGLINSVAPWRGLLDPNYRGYRFGLLSAPGGPRVTLLAGLVVVGAVASACIAVRNRRGSAMLWVAAVDAALLLNLTLGFWLTAGPSSFEIQFGEYLTIPGPIGLAVILVVFLGPLAAGAAWAVRRSGWPAGRAAF